MTGKFLALYPSGNEMALEGQLIRGIIPNTDIFGVGVVTEKEVVILDPRCVVQDSNGCVVYHPREVMNEPGFQSGMRDWLVENPHWAAH